MKKKNYSYFKGIKLPKCKFLSQISIEGEILPKFVYIPVKQSKEGVPVVCVKKGDKVLIGSVVARIGENKIISSVSGEVVDVRKLPSVLGGFCDCVVIRNNGKNEEHKLAGLKEEEWVLPSIKNKLNETQLVDYDGETFLHKLIGQESDKMLESVIVNFMTDEPYSYTNYFVLNNFIDEIFKSLSIIRSATNLKSITFAIPKMYKAYDSSIKEKFKTYASVAPFVKIAYLSNRYPLGDKDLLFKKITKNKKHIDPRKLGCLVVDAMTLVDFKRVIVDGIHPVSRLISIWIDDEKNQKPILTQIRIGTSINEIVKKYRGENLINKIVAGGPMRGVALTISGAATIQTQKSLFLTSQHEISVKEENPCNKCGKCIGVCPQKLIPYEIELASINNDFVMAKNWGAEKCTKCGCCGFVCPSKRHLVQRIDFAKDQIKKRRI